MMRQYELDIDLKDKDDKYKMVDTQGVASLVTRNNHFARDEGGKLYYYKGGVYRVGAEDAIHLAVVELFDTLASDKNKWSMKRGIEVFQYIRIKAPLLQAAPTLNRINLLNGIFDTDTGTLEKHDPSYLTTVQLNINYDPTATCPNWTKFINSVFPEGEGKILGYEIPAWLMVPYTENQKSVVLLGSGANGKSIYLHGILEFLGNNNSCNIPLQKLGDRFTTTLLLDKLANISPDLPNTKIANTSEFKALTGGDYISGEYKHGGQFKFRPYARCLFACNELPDTPDASDGFYRRLVIIEFEKKFKEDPELGRRLKAAISTPKELSGLFNACLKVLPDVLRRGLTETESMKNIVEEHRKENDPVAQWLDEFTVEDPKEHIVKSDLFTEYQKSGNIGKASKNSIAFGRAIRRYRPSIKTKQVRADGLVQNAYAGIRLKTEVEDMDWNISDDSLVEAGLDTMGLELDGMEVTEGEEIIDIHAATEPVEI